MTNKLTLEQILGIVQKKYPLAYINESYENSIILDDYGPDDFSKLVVVVSEPIIFWVVGGNTKVIFENNIIELKHYLGLEIEWEDLKEYAKNKNLRIDTTILAEKIEYIYVVGNQLFKNKDIANYCDCVENRSYWQMYQIIKNLTE